MRMKIIYAVFICIIFGAILFLSFFPTKNGKQSGRKMRGKSNNFPKSSKSSEDNNLGVDFPSDLENKNSDNKYFSDYSELENSQIQIPFSENSNVILVEQPYETSNQPDKYATSKIKKINNFISDKNQTEIKKFNTFENLSNKEKNIFDNQILEYKNSDCYIVSVLNLLLTSEKLRNIIYEIGKIDSYDTLIDILRNILSDFKKNSGRCINLDKYREKIIDLCHTTFIKLNEFGDPIDFIHHFLDESFQNYKNKIKDVFYFDLEQFQKPKNVENRFYVGNKSNKYFSILNLNKHRLDQNLNCLSFENDFILNKPLFIFVEDLSNKNKIILNTLIFNKTKYNLIGCVCYEHNHYYCMLTTDKYPFWKLQMARKAIYDDKLSHQKYARIIIYEREE